MTVALWILALLLVLAGLAGTVVPALPGAPLVFAGLLVAAWIDGFARVGPWTLAVLGVLAALTIAVDVLSTTLGVKRAGASRGALIGAAIGTVVGLFLGLVGVLVGPFVGALIGEFAVRRDWQQAGRAGVATWIGLAVGTALKIAIVFAMLGVFALALLISGCGRAKPAAAGVSAERESGGWEEVRIGTDAVFNGLHFVDSSVGWIVGGSPFVDGGVIGRTEDGGRTWRYVTGVTKGGRSSGLNAVHGFDRMRACAVGDGVFLTFDGGASWQRAQAAPGARLLGALDFRDGNEGWAVGATGVFHTTDAGLTWAVVDGKDSAARHANGRVLHFTDVRSGWLAGKHGALLRTLDGGATWARVPIPAPANTENAPDLWGGAWLDASHGWLVGEYGTVLRTADGGDTWTLVDAGTRDAVFTAVAFAGADGWIVGYLPNGAARSVVTRTRDGGATWALERTLDGEELRAIQALDADTAWAVGDRVRTEPQQMLRRPGRPG